MIGKAAIIGGSMSGLFAALILRRRGWSVDIYEASRKELAGRGAGIITHAGLGEALAAAGVTSDDLGVPVRGRRVYNHDGSIHGAIDFPQTNTSWDRLFDLLKSALPAGSYRLGKRLDAIRSDPAGVDLTFDDGTTARADLVVGADGFRSAVRHAFLPGIDPTYAGYVAWRGLVEEAELSPEARRELFDSFTFCLPPGEQMLGYPVAGRDNDLRPGHRRFNFVWYRPAAEGAGLDRMLTDETGRRHDISIPPPLIDRQVIAEMRVAADTVLAPLFREAVSLARAPFFQPIYDLAVPRMTAERIALIGDAAFVARPHVGAGVTKAAEDALALAGALAAHDDIGAALAAFEADRLPIGHRIIDQARRLGSYMQAQIKTAEEQAAAERHRSPEAVMVETASVAFLEAAAESA